MSPWTRAKLFGYNGRTQVVRCQILLKIWSRSCKWWWWWHYPRACTKIIKYFLFSEIEGPSGEFSFHRSPIGLLVNRGGLERPTNWTMPYQASHSWLFHNKRNRCQKNGPNWRFQIHSLLQSSIHARLIYALVITSLEGFSHKRVWYKWTGVTTEAKCLKT